LRRTNLYITVSEGTEREFHLKDFDQICLVGAGKASAPMAQAIEEILGDRITRGLIVTKYGHSLP